MAALTKAKGPIGSTLYVDTTSCSESEDDTREATSILDVLKAPKVSVENLKHWTTQVVGSSGVRHPPLAPNQKSPEQRIQESQGEQLVIYSHKACREEVNLKCSTIQNRSSSYSNSEAVCIIFQWVYSGLNILHLQTLSMWAGSHPWT